MPYYPPLILKPAYLLTVSSLALLRHGMHTQTITEVSATGIPGDRDLGDQCLEASGWHRPGDQSAFPMVHSQHTQIPEHSSASSVCPNLGKICCQSIRGHRVQRLLPTVCLVYPEDQ